jgi:hypothetical protein
VSFDASDTPRIAREAKTNYLKAIGRPFPEDAWKFLTGPERSIHDLTEAAQGKSVTGLKKALLYCFSHEPPGQSKFFNFMGVVGLITLAAMAAFFVYLQVTVRRYREGRVHDARK